MLLSIQPTLSVTCLNSDWEPEMPFSPRVSKNKYKPKMTQHHFLVNKITESSYSSLICNQNIKPYSRKMSILVRPWWAEIECPGQFIILSGCPVWELAGPSGVHKRFQLEWFLHLKKQNKTKAPRLIIFPLLAFHCLLARSKCTISSQSKYFLHNPLALELC